MFKSFTKTRFLPVSCKDIKFYCLGFRSNKDNCPATLSLPQKKFDKTFWMYPRTSRLRVAYRMSILKISQNLSEKIGEVVLTKKCFLWEFWNFFKVALCLRYSDGIFETIDVAYQYCYVTIEEPHLFLPIISPLINLLDFIVFEFL